LAVSGLVCLSAATPLAEWPQPGHPPPADGVSGYAQEKDHQGVLIMARVTVENGELRVEIEGLHKIWALRGGITVPLDHVRGATAGHNIVSEPKGLRAPGTHIPGVFVAGTFHKNGEKIFWDVRDATRAVVIELRDESFARLVLEGGSNGHS
jgi:hypothetical protein